MAGARTRFAADKETRQQLEQDLWKGRLMADEAYPGRFKSKSDLVTGRPRTTRVVKPVAKEDYAAKLVSFSVATDSVVATVRLTFDDSHSHVSLHWGDDTVDEINLTKLKQQSKMPGEQQDPNMLELQHAYRPPLDQGRRIILAKVRSVDGSYYWESAVVELVQRYVFRFYPISLIFPEHLDSAFEDHSEMEVRLAFYQGSDRIKSEVWVEDIFTNPNIGPLPGEDAGPRWHLTGSEFTTEISYTDEPIVIHMDILEFDGPGKYGGAVNVIWDFVTTPFQWLWWVAENVPIEFDTSQALFQLPLEIHPSGKGDPVFTFAKTQAYFDIPFEGRLIVEFEMEMKLIVPMNDSLEQVMTSS